MNITTKTPAIKHNFSTNESVFFTDTLITEYHLTLEVTGLGSWDFLCTPNQLTELVVGFLYTKGLISCYSDITQLSINEDEAVARVVLTVPVNMRIPQPPKLTTFVAPLAETLTLSKEGNLDMNHVLNLIKAFKKPDELFEQTGALHCCLIAVEDEIRYRTLDIGRHNAIDKAIGLALMEGCDFSQCMLLTSGRTPMEIVEKVIFAGIPTLVSRSAPTHQAVSLAKEYGINLLGFAGLERVNIYSLTE